MFSIFKKINRLVGEPLVWTPVNEDDTKFVCSKYNSQECWLQMNDFPDEPLWTLYYKGDKKTIEDTPYRWKINYRK